jgi:DNA-binding MarR family transcriptional regulator
MTPLPPMPTEVRAIYSAYADLMIAVHSMARRHNVSPASILLIAFLGDQELTAAQLLNDNLPASTNLSYTLSVLENRGWVARSGSDVGDRRKRLIRLTEDGLTICAAIRNELTFGQRAAA